MEKAMACVLLPFGLSVALAVELFCHGKWAIEYIVWWLRWSKLYEQKKQVLFLVFCDISLLPKIRIAQ